MRALSRTPVTHALVSMKTELPFDWFELSLFLLRPLRILTSVTRRPPSTAYIISLAEHFLFAELAQLVAERASVGSNRAGTDVDNVKAQEKSAHAPREGFPTSTLDKRKKTLRARPPCLPFLRVLWLLTCVEFLPMTSCRTDQRMLPYRQ